MKTLTSVVISLRTIGRLMKRLRVRRRRGKSVGPFPRPEKQRRKRMELMRQLIGRLPANGRCVREDEADINVNPKIGVDWTLPGTQRLVTSAGKIAKRYLAGAKDAATDQLTWVCGCKRKSSGLLIEFLEKLKSACAGRKVIHMILDSDTTHSSRQSRAWLSEHGSVLQLHFLSPYSPNNNRIERKLWREVHANVTARHAAEDINTLFARIRGYMVRFNNTLRESRTAI